MTDHIVREYILIIEDEEPIVRVLLRTLHHAGFHASAAFNADQALNAVDENTPTLILLDAHLPLISGIEICRMLRAKHATRLTPILFVTGDDSAEQRFAATQAGVDGFLAKPFRPTELIERVNTLLSAKHHVDDFRLQGC